MPKPKTIINNEKAVMKWKKQQQTKNLKMIMKKQKQHDSKN